MTRASRIDSSHKLYSLSNVVMKEISHKYHDAAGTGTV